MGDWRFTHAAMLSLTPLRANITWNTNNDPRCRRSQVGRETVNHLINACSTHRRYIIQRHNIIMDLVAVPQNIRVACEKRFGNLQPDLSWKTSRRTRRSSSISKSLLRTHIYLTKQHRTTPKSMSPLDAPLKFTVEELRRTPFSLELSAVSHLIVSISSTGS